MEMPPGHHHQDLHIVAFQWSGFLRAHHGLGTGDFFKKKQVQEWQESGESIGLVNGRGHGELMFTYVYSMVRPVRHLYGVMFIQ